MPWKETNVLDMRMQFIALYLQQCVSFCELCRHFGISRTTGYKLVERYEQLGPSGLLDQSRAPYSHPNSTPEQIQDQIIDFRKDHPHWGPKKLRTVLMRDHPDIAWPAPSTIGQLLMSRNLVKSRRKGHSGKAVPTHLSVPDAPNHVWTADFKGQFALQDKSMCYPLTICDNFAKMILACSGLSNTATDPAKAVWVATFRENGLPRVIRTDNGTPFASRSIGGLSRLSAWWIRLGIIPQRIAPGKPQQNGSHERMHKTLKAEVASQPAADFKSQQRAFNNFVYEYNHIRPHEALGQRVPASLYEVSSRQYPLILPDIEYPADFTIRHVRTNGEIRWRGELLFVSEVLTGEYVGLEQLDDRHWALYYGPVPLAILDGYQRSWLPSQKAVSILKQLTKEISISLQNC
jgi:transposase InsO family protein